MYKKKIAIKEVTSSTEEDLIKKIQALEESDKINHTLLNISTAVTKTSNLDELYKSIHESLTQLSHI